jgi:VanZ family protein
MSFRSRWKRSAGLWLPVIGWAALIFLLSAQSDLHVSNDPGVDWPVRKAAHITIFGILAVLTARALTGSRSGHVLWLAAVLAGVYAASDELHQAFVAGRSPLVTDVLIDLAGVAVGLLVWQRFLASRPRRADPG